jgi:hypothetical protein
LIGPSIVSQGTDADLFALLLRFSIAPQVQLQECIQPETHRPHELGWIKLQLEVAETCAHFDLLQLVLQGNEQRNSGAK